MTLKHVPLFLIAPVLFFAACAKPAGDANPLKAPTLGTPVCTNGTISTPANRFVSGKLSITDSSATKLTIKITKAPLHGAVELSSFSDGVFVYTPNTNFTGVDTFKFIASNGTNACAETTLSAIVGTLSSNSLASTQGGQRGATSGGYKYSYSLGANLAKTGPGTTASGYGYNLNFQGQVK